MKLFGNSSRKRHDNVPHRSAQNANTRQPQRSAPKKSGGMSGRAKGTILLTFSICVFLGAIVMCLSVLYSSAAVAPSNNNRNHNTRVDVDPSSGSTATIPQNNDGETVENTDDGVFNILICGTDGDGGRTDTIIIANLNTGTNEVSLLSIPRDT